MTAEWQMTDTKLLDAVKLTIPAWQVVPIVFVPGIMGSNLANLKNDPVWLLNGTFSAPARLAGQWATKSAGQRQKVLHPKKTKVYTEGNVPSKPVGSVKTSQEYTDRGWGEVAETSYHDFLVWLEQKMNGSPNPALWADFTFSSIGPTLKPGEKRAEPKLFPGITMGMKGLPGLAEPGYPTAPVTSDELLKRAKSRFPVYACGYNWLASNQRAAELLQLRIAEIIKKHNVGFAKCSQVILVTHSMGGLVARACSQLPGMDKTIVGIVHGVMPATGAAVAYRRCKVGMKDEDFKAGLVIGSNGREVTAVFAQAPGALQLLPSEDYGSNWMTITDPAGKIVTSLPNKDPYEEIYLRKESWWGLIREEWLTPEDGIKFKWDEFVVNIEQAKQFHRNLASKYHPKTFVFYGGGPEKKSFSKVNWTMKKGIPPPKPGGARAAKDVLTMKWDEVRTDGSNNLYAGGETVFTTVPAGRGSTQVRTETSFWEMRCAMHDSSGDGTVPVRSGEAPRKSGKANILQQFVVAAIPHEGAYKEPPAQLVTYYALTKLAALAKIQ